MLSTNHLYRSQEDILYENLISKFSDPKTFEKIDNNLKDVKSKIKSKLNSLERELISNNIDTKLIKNSIKLESKKLLTKIKSLQNSPKEAGKFLAQEFINIVNGNIIKFHKINSKLIKTVIIFSLIFFIHYFIFELVLSISGNLSLTVTLTSLFTTPLIDESLKYILIKKGYTENVVMFSVFEFLLYIIKFLALGMPIHIAIGIRLVPLLMDFINTYIMHKYRKEADKDKKDSKFPLMIAIIIHFFVALSMLQFVDPYLENIKS